MGYYLLARNPRGTHHVSHAHSMILPSKSIVTGLLLIQRSRDTSAIYPRKASSAHRRSHLELSFSTRTGLRSQTQTRTRRITNCLTCLSIISNSMPGDGRSRSSGVGGYVDGSGMQFAQPLFFVLNFHFLLFTAVALALLRERPLSRRSAFLMDPARRTASHRICQRN